MAVVIVMRLVQIRLVHSHVHVNEVLLVMERQNVTVSQNLCSIPIEQNSSQRNTEAPIFPHKTLVACQTSNNLSIIQFEMG